MTRWPCGSGRTEPYTLDGSVIHKCVRRSAISLPQQLTFSWQHIQWGNISMCAGTSQDLVTFVDLNKTLVRDISVLSRAKR